MRSLNRDHGSVVDWDDNQLHSVCTLALIKANDKEAPVSEYWTSFMGQGETLAAHCKVQECSVESMKWADWQERYTFVAMQQAYAARFDGKSSPKEAFDVIRRYCELKEAGEFCCEPITLHREGEGAHDHNIEIERKKFTYKDLDGNHRLMAAYYLNIAHVRVKLLSERGT